MSYEILGFHVENPMQQRQISGDPDASSMFDVLLASARRFDTSVTLTVLTTALTDLSGITREFRRVEGDVDIHQLMLERTRAQRSYIKRHLGPRPLALLDSDIIINRDIGPIFTQDFDIGLTWRRSNDDMPFNAGVIFVNNKRIDAVTRFFDKWLQLYESSYNGRAEWYGDQFALSELVQLPDLPDHGTAIDEQDGIRYCFLPCRDFNFTPRWRSASLLTTDIDNKILHFKALSRRLMMPVWHYRISTNETDALLNKARLLARFAELSLYTRAYRKESKSDERRILNKNLNS